MSLSQIFKRVIIPCAAGVTGAEGHTFGPNCSKKNDQGTRPSDLPIYSKECSVCGQTETNVEPPSGMEETVGNIRRELWVWQDSLKGYRHKIVDVYRNGFSKADSVIDYLREEEHGPQRVGAIGIAGLAGYILGMRRGVIRRLFYGCCGALSMAAICYPNEAMDYVESIVLEGRRVFIVAYHFIYGESPKMPDWLEKFIGSQPQELKQVNPAAAASAPEESKANETLFDLKKIMPNEEETKKKQK